MKPILLCMAIALAALAEEKREDSPARQGGGRQEKPKEEKTTAKPKSDDPAAKIPPEATRVDTDRWRYVDKDGKAWIYQVTPFGVMRKLEAPDPELAKIDVPPGVTAVDQGDSIKFTRPSPFGVFTWVRKKDEPLTDLEKAVWEREQQKKSAPAKAEGKE